MIARPRTAVAALAGILSLAACVAAPAILGALVGGVIGLCS
jgi:hypothetical protein